MSVKSLSTKELIEELAKRTNEVQDEGETLVQEEGLDTEWAKIIEEMENTYEDVPVQAVVRICLQMESCKVSLYECEYSDDDYTILQKNKVGIIKQQKALQKKVDSFCKKVKNLEKKNGFKEDELWEYIE